MLAQLKETTAWIQERVAEIPEIAIILGTGLGDLTTSIEETIAFSYEEIPHFPLSTVEGHRGKLIFGKLGEKKVMVLQGRFHYYEGYDMKQVTYPIRVMQLLGIKYLFVSNAAGGMNRSFQVGDIMLIEDHINLFPEHPLRGKHDPRLGLRFPDMSEAYSLELRHVALEIAKENNIKLQTGVYVGTQGPSFETPAEYNYLRIMGGDTVGMSTVPEVIVAVDAQIKVLAFSVVTDLAIAGRIEKVTHAEVMEAAKLAQANLTFLIKEVITRVSVSR
ncbi:MAG: purine-nucleoside phosphorylase [Dysgonamonadaceae bacterium]|jgi:purine-nucleoside phosphorylase|nr:purine-nucleoside phosphorylase [Dysgonamonadaceae bacterium]